jgi:hypothetical protein
MLATAVHTCGTSEFAMPSAPAVSHYATTLQIFGLAAAPRTIVHVDLLHPHLLDHCWCYP